MSTNNPQGNYPNPQEPHNQQNYGAPQYQPQTNYGAPQYQPGVDYTSPGAEPAKSKQLKTFLLISFGLSLLSVVLGIIAVFATDALSEATAEEMAAQNLSTAELEAALQFSQVMGIGIVIVSAIFHIVLYMLVYFGLRSNKNWARITGIVFAILGTLSNIFALFTSFGAFETQGAVIAIINLLLVVALIGVNIYWLVLAFNSEVAAWYKGANSLQWQ